MIEYHNLKALNLLEQVKLKLICRRGYKKLKRVFPDSKLKIEIKVHEDGNNKKRKFSLHGKILDPSLKIATTKAVDWDISKVTHKLMEKLRSESYKKERLLPDYLKAKR